MTEMHLDFLGPSTGLRELADSIRAVLTGSGRAPHTAYDADAPAWDASAWKALADLDILGVGLTEKEGGSGGTLMDLAFVAEQLGRALAAVPFVSAMMSRTILEQQPASRARDRLLQDLLAGRTVVAVADSPTLQLTNAAGPRLSGECTLLPDGAGARRLLLAGPDDRLYCVDLTRQGVTTQHPPTFDRTMRPGVATLEDAPATPIGQSAADALVHATTMGRLLLAAEAVGVGARALEITVDYAKIRQQFGRPIGAFQAIKHRAAEMLVAVENGRSAVLVAADALDRHYPDATVQVDMAKAVASENASRVVKDAMQSLGAIAMTWEHDLHLLLRRAKSIEWSLGTPDVLWEGVAAHLLD